MQKLRHRNSYLDMDRVEREIHRVLSNRRQHEPSQSIEVYAQVEDFAIRRTKINNFAKKFDSIVNLYSVTSFRNLLNIVFCRTSTQ